MHKSQESIENAIANCDLVLESNASANDKAKAVKQKGKLVKQLAETRIYDQAIAHIAHQRISLLKDFNSNISDLRYINENDRFVPVVESNLPEYLPLSMYGDGMKKVLTILDALVSAENGIVLVDEFETALHTSAMENVFKFIILACKKLKVIF